MTARRLRTRAGFTVLELAVAFVITTLIIAAVATTLAASLDRADRVAADQALDRVATAQIAHARGFGTYAYGDGGDDAALREALPEELSRSLTLTHGASSGPEQVSIAVGDEQTLVVAVQLPDGACRWRTLPAISSVAASLDGDLSGQESASVLCTAADLLPVGERPAWD